MRGDSATSVMNQVHDLAWHTAVFRTLNEARRLEPARSINGAMWELITAGYANLMTLGIRCLVDHHADTNSLWNVIVQIEKRPELLTREFFVCYDGLPYDIDAARQRYIASLDLSKGTHVGWLSTSGPDAWATSEIMHLAFDKFSGGSAKRKRTDKIRSDVIEKLKTQLNHSAIKSVCTMADKRVAHAERIAEGSDAIPVVTYNDIDKALAQIVRVTNYLSSHFFHDTVFGSVVPTPQFNVLEALDEPWVTTQNIPALHTYWDEICESMDKWIRESDDL